MTPKKCRSLYIAYISLFSDFAHNHLHFYWHSQIQSSYVVTRQLLFGKCEFQTVLTIINAFRVFLFKGHWVFERCWCSGHCDGIYEEIRIISCAFKITRIDVYETLCPQQMLVHKDGKIKNWGGECRDVTPTKLQSQNIFKESTGGGGGVGLGGGGGQDGCQRRNELKFL